MHNTIYGSGSQMAVRVPLGVRVGTPGADVRFVNKYIYNCYPFKIVFLIHFQ